MKEVIDSLQTLVLCLTLLLTVFTLGWVVYAFRRVVILFNGLIEEFEKPRVYAQTATTTAAVESEVRQAEAQAPEAVPPIKRYPCHRCKAKLPEVPTHSRIEGETTFLVFKCKRCGKETEVDPATETVKPAA